MRTASCLALAWSAAAGQVPDVMVVYKTHFDIGYTGLASEVIQRYRTGMIDNALALVDSSKSLPPEERFVWTLPGWPLRKIMEDWPGQTALRKERIRDAFGQGRFAVHALPFSLHTESLGEEDLVRGLGFSASLSREFGRPVPRAAKMTDVPSHSWILPTLLKHAGIGFLHIGCNPASRSPEVPNLFLWEGPDGSRLLTWYDQDYGSGPYPPKEWPSPTWMNMKMTGDNQGPPTNAEIKAMLAQYRAASKRVQVGTLDDVETLLNSVGAALPVVRGDMPDTWIHGIGSMPVESKAARNLRSALPDLDALNTLLCLQGVSGEEVKQTVTRAYEHSLRFGEHTWGLNDPFEDYGDLWLERRRNGMYQRMESSWAEKGAGVRASGKSVDSALASKLSALAAATPVGGRRVVVYNPLPWKHTGAVTVAVEGSAPVALQEAPGGIVLPVSVQAKELRFIAKDVPPMGYKTYAFAAPGILPTLPDTVRESASERVLENAVFRIVLDPAGGGIGSILDKRTGKELVQNTGGEGGAGRYLNERFSQNEIQPYLAAYLKSTASWGTDDLGKRGLPAATYRMEPATGMALRFEGDGLRRSAVLTSGPTGRHQGMELRVTLHATLPYVDIRWSVQSRIADPWPESEWLAFPLNLSTPRFRLQRVGGIVDPSRDLVRGSNHDMFSLSGGVAVSTGDGSGVGLCSRDLSLVSLDRMGSWKYSRDFVPQRPRVYFNLYNNQWDTNFQQWFEGSWGAEVRLWSFAAYAGDSSLVTPSEETRHPLVAALADGPAGKAAATASGPSLSRPGILVTAFGTNPDGAGSLLRLWEVAGTGGPVTVTLPAGMGVSRVQPLDLRGEPAGGALPVIAGRFETTLPRNTPLSLRMDYERCVTPIGAGKPRPASPRNLDRFRVAGTRFSIPKNWADLKVTLQVHDFTGKLRGRLQAGSTSIDLHQGLGLPEGVYFIRVQAP